MPQLPELIIIFFTLCIWHEGLPGIMPDSEPAADSGTDDTRHQISGIKHPGPLILEPAKNRAANWKIFKQKWDNYSIITRLDAQTADYQMAVFLHSIGDDALRIYNGFDFTTTNGKPENVTQITEKFKTFAIGTVNETHERYVFNKCVEGTNSFEIFMTNLRDLSRTCNFCDKCLPSLLRDRLVVGIREPATQELLLREKNLTLEQAIDICRAAENATNQAKVFRNDSTTETDPVHRIEPSKPFRPRPRNPTGPENSYYNLPKKCYFCNKIHVLKKSLCPAYGRTCSVCKKPNHFPGSVKCSQQNVQQLEYDNESETSDSEEWIQTLDAEDQINSLAAATVYKDIRCKMLVDGKPVTFQVDSGSSVCTLPAHLCLDTELIPTETKLKMWNGARYKPRGKCSKILTNPKSGQSFKIEFIVAEGNFNPLLGHQVSVKMGLYEVHESKFERVSKIDSVPTPPIISSYNDIFTTDKIGNLPGVQKIRVDPNAVPVVMPSRRLPVAWRQPIHDELLRLVEKDVLARVETHTPWVSQMVPVQKPNGRFRICLDPKELNKELLRERYPITTLDDVIHEIGNATVFSKADLANGYWHVSLDDESSYLTTFQTPFGRFRWKVLPFGLSVSSEIFQRKLTEALSNLPGIINVADDITIFGTDEADHDRKLEALFRRCREVGIKLNREKMELKRDSVSFLGHIISKDGLRADPEKVKEIVEMPPPENVADLRHFLGCTAYVAKFIPNASALTAPLNNLLKIDVPWNWSESQDVSFRKIKTLLTSAPVLTYYDPNTELILENDASEFAMGSCLLQNAKPIAYASRTMPETERRSWAQIEKEMGAVLFGLDKFRQYTFGRPVTVITDHQPLETISKKPLSKAPKRLQTMLLRAMEYDYTIVYRPGKTLKISDFLSRLPAKKTGPPDPELIQNVTFNHVLPPHRLEEISTATSSDPVLRKLEQSILAGWPDQKAQVPQEIISYFPYRDELTACGGVIYRGDRIVVPTSLRSDMKNRVHMGHLGLNACLRRARDLIFWPQMSKEITQMIESCGICNAYPRKQSNEPILPHPVPDRPWQKVGSDVFVIKEKNYLVTVDYFSSFFEIDLLSNVTSYSIIHKLKQHFARYGTPDVLISDNGAAYTSGEFQQFTAAWRITHQTISPGNSRANGCAEAAVKTAKRVIKRSLLAGQDPYQALLNVRNTPSEGQNTSPVQRSLGRRTQSLIPNAASKMDIDSPTIQSAGPAKQALKNKQTDREAQVGTQHELPPLQIGDTVRMEPIAGEGEWKEGTVTGILKPRSYIVTTNAGKSYRRNRKFLRKVRKFQGIQTTSSLHLSTPQVPPHIPVAVPSTPEPNIRPRRRLLQGPPPPPPRDPYNLRPRT